MMSRPSCLPAVAFGEGGSRMSRRALLRNGAGLAAILAAGKAPAALVRSMLAARNGFAAGNPPESFLQLRDAVRSFGSNQSAAQNALVGLVIDDYWTSTSGVVVSAPMRVVNVGWYQDESGNTVLGAKCQRVTASGDVVQYDAAEQEEASEELAESGLYYYGKSGNTYTRLQLSAGDAIPYGSYDKVFHNSLRSDSNMLTRGCNAYIFSALRQYLNSASSPGSWWSPSHVGDSAPSQANTVRGYVAGCSHALLASLSDGQGGLLKVKIPCIASSYNNVAATVIDDTFFPSSKTELYGAAFSNEGTADYYYVREAAASGVTAPSNNNATINALRARLGCTRTGSQTNSYRVWIANSSGVLSQDNTTATSNITCAVACVIY